MSGLRHAHPGVGMLTAAAPVGASSTPTVVADEGSGADIRHASIRYVYMSIRIGGVGDEIQNRRNVIRRSRISAVSARGREGSCSSLNPVNRGCGRAPVTDSDISEQIASGYRDSEVVQFLSTRLRGFIVLSVAHHLIIRVAC